MFWNRDFIERKRNMKIFTGTEKKDYTWIGEKLLEKLKMMFWNEW